MYRIKLEWSVLSSSIDAYSYAATIMRLLMVLVFNWLQGNFKISKLYKSNTTMLLDALLNSNETSVWTIAVQLWA